MPLVVLPMLATSFMVMMDLQVNSTSRGVTGPKRPALHEGPLLAGNQP